MDLNLAIAIHNEWKTFLLAAIINNEKLDATSIAKDNCCELGKWLYSDGKIQFEMLSGFAACVTKHAVFHAEAAKVAERINTRHYQEAHAMLRAGTAYSTASNKLQASLLSLQLEAGLSTFDLCD